MGLGKGLTPALAQGEYTDLSWPRTFDSGLEPATHQRARRAREARSFPRRTDSVAGPVPSASDFVATEARLSTIRPRVCGIRRPVRLEVAPFEAEGCERWIVEPAGRLCRRRSPGRSPCAGRLGRPPSRPPRRRSRRTGARTPRTGAAGPGSASRPRAPARRRDRPRSRPDGLRILAVTAAAPEAMGHP